MGLQIHFSANYICRGQLSLPIRTECMFPNLPHLCTDKEKKKHMIQRGKNLNDKICIETYIRKQIHCLFIDFYPWQIV